jgi:hypothetical protein
LEVLKCVFNPLSELQLDEGARSRTRTSRSSRRR